MVTDTELVNRLHELLRTADLDNTTTASVRRSLEKDLGIDLSDRKAFIREKVDLFLESRNPDNDSPPNDDAVDNDDGSEEQVADEEADDDDGEEEEEEDDESNGKRPKKSDKEVKKTGRGFSKPCALSPQLQKLVGAPVLARTEVVKKIWVYIKEKNLQKPSDKRKILCDDILHDIFRVKSINMFQMNKALTKHIWPLDEEEAPIKTSKKKRPNKEDTDEEDDEEEAEEEEEEKEEEEEDDDDDDDDDEAPVKPSKKRRNKEDTDEEDEEEDDEEEEAPTKPSKKKRRNKEDTDEEDEEEEAPTKPSKKKRRNKDDTEEEEEDSDAPKGKRKQVKGNGKGKGSGFLARIPISDALGNFFEIDDRALSRSDVIKRMWDYIKRNNLQDPSDRRRILCDYKLKELFKVDSFVGFTVTKLLKPHFIKEE